MEEWQGAELGPPLLPVPPEVAAQLTNDIWANVFRKLRLPALARLQCVCRTWRALSKATHVPETCRVNATQLSRELGQWLAGWGQKECDRITQLIVTGTGREVLHGYAGFWRGQTTEWDAAFMGCRLSYVLAHLPNAFALDLLPPRLETLKLHITLSHSIQSCTFPTLEHLRTLDIRISMTESFEPTTDDGCIVYPHGMLATLRHLSVRDHCADDQIVPQVSALSKLCQLDIVVWVLPKATVDEKLAYMPRLAALNLRVPCLDASELEGLVGISSLQELCVKTTYGEVEEGVKRHLRSGAASVAAHKFALWSSEKSRKRTRTETQEHQQNLAGGRGAGGDLPTEWAAVADKLRPNLRRLSIKVLTESATHFMRHALVEQFLPVPEVAAA